jgi:hypothetical protein
MSDLSFLPHSACLGKLPSSALYGGVTLGTTIGVTGDGDFLHTSLCDFQCVLWQAEPQYLVPQQPQLNLAPIDEQKAHDASNDILLRFVKCVGVWGFPSDIFKFGCGWKGRREKAVKKVKFLHFLLKQ